MNKNNEELINTIEMVKSGLPVDLISKNISWQNFENIVTEILYSYNFSIIQNLIFTKPRMEIDVIGTRLGISLLIDCKHWKKYNNHQLKKSVKKQIIRSERYIHIHNSIIGIPMIVTLYDTGIHFIDNVPIVPISRFASFINEFYDYLDKIKTISIS